MLLLAMAWQVLQVLLCLLLPAAQQQPGTPPVLS
jgi:hypothetical protein